MTFTSHCEFGDCIEVLQRMPEKLADCCVTSPPYWRMRDYGVEGQLGLEELDEYIVKMVEVFREVRRVLRDDGTLWLNLGDSYVQGGRGGGDGWEHSASKGVLRATPAASGCRYKNLIGVPWRVALALQDDGWNLRSDIIWHKPNAMPESVNSRPTKSHEYIFLMSKSRDYYYDSIAIQERSAGEVRRRWPSKKSGANSKAMRSSTEARGRFPEYRNKRSVWTVANVPYQGAHFATYPPDLIKPCILAGSRIGGIVLDPFFGSGTTGRVAEDLGRRWLGIEINEGYRTLIEQRTAQTGMVL